MKAKSCKHEHCWKHAFRYLCEFDGLRVDYWLDVCVSLFPSYRNNTKLIKRREISKEDTHIPLTLY
jgi:hypothetical protein